MIFWKVNPSQDEVYKINQLFVARASFMNGLHIGYAKNLAECWISYGGQQHKCQDNFELLCLEDDDKISTKKEDEDYIPILGGWEESGQKLYVCLVNREDDLQLIGKAVIMDGSCSHCNYGFEGKEYCTKESKMLKLLYCKRELYNPDSTLEGFQERKPIRFLTSINELLETNYNGNGQGTNKSKIKTTTRGTGKRKVILCHDMKGGYCKSADEDYLKTFTSWDRIDIFIYFSHNRVSIPPQVWIDACNDRGVTCLGTLITEHAKESSENEKLLQNDEMAIKKLVQLTEFYGFDGYLINIESPIDSSSTTAASMDKFTAFLKKLTMELKSVNSENGMVLYYDSLNKKGEISYQNCLNQENVSMFDVCDGIFTNYWWDQSKLQSCLKYSNARSSDVYIGIDVFGRGEHICHGPGYGCKDAITLIPESLSIALFAPGWTLECGPCKDCESLAVAVQKDREFWDAIFGPEKQN